MTKLFTIFLLILISHWLFGQDIEAELIGDRPDMTESAYTVAKGHLQFETGFDYSMESTYERTTTFNSSLIRYGISNKAELRFGFEMSEFKQNDFENFSVPFYLGSKIALKQNKGLIPQVALILATGLEKVEVDNPDFLYDFTPQAILTFENSLTDNLALGYNLGFEYSTTDQAITGIISASLGIGLSEKTGCFIEVAAFPSNLTSDARFNAGLTHSFTEKFQADFYGGIGLLHDSPISNIGVGFIYLFQLQEIR